MTQATNAVLLDARVAVEADHVLTECRQRPGVLRLVASCEAIGFLYMIVQVALRRWR